MTEITEDASPWDIAAALRERCLYGDSRLQNPQAHDPLANVAANELERLSADKEAAYLERNRLVALLASLYPSGIARTAIPGWSDDWHGCVYVDLPTGQASWHYHDSHAHLFAHLPPYKKTWDGHTTEQKYERVAALTAKPHPTVDEIVVWFNAWLKEPIDARDRVIISDSIGHALRHSPDIYRANETAQRREKPEAR